MTTTATTEQVEVPADACRLRGNKVQFEPVEGGKNIPITMLARTADPIEHPYWYGGRVVHDMAGMILHKDVIPADYCHWEEIGYLDQHDADAKKGLTVSGALVPTSAPDDLAKKIAERSAGGVPYEASIDFAGPMAVEYLDDGLTAEVNGRTFEGPLSIVRKWVLRGVAVCPYGADMNTSSQFSREQKPVIAEITKLSGRNSPPPGEDPGMPSAKKLTQHKGEDAMSETAEATKDQETESASDSTEKKSAEESTATESTPAESSDTPSESNAELKRFVDAFGAEAGAGYLLKGMKFEDAMAAEFKKLSNENAKLKQRLTGKESAEKLGEGEEQPNGFSASDADGGGEKKKTGFASTIKIK